jgi:vacuolar-type H+-ATPase subunit E/Vma4
MFFREELMRARQDDLLREAERIRLAARARRTRRTAAAVMAARQAAGWLERRAL